MREEKFKLQSTRHPITCIHAIVSCGRLIYVTYSDCLVQACFFVYTRSLLMLVLLFLWFFSVNFLSYVPPFFLSIFFGHTACTCERVWVSEWWIHLSLGYLYYKFSVLAQTSMSLLVFFLHLVQSVCHIIYTPRTCIYMCAWFGSARGVPISLWHMRKTKSNNRRNLFSIFMLSLSLCVSVCVSASTDSAGKERLPS